MQLTQIRMSPAGNRNIIAGHQATVGGAARQTNRLHETTEPNVLHQADQRNVIGERARIVVGHVDAFDANVDGRIGTIGGQLLLRSGCRIVDAVDVGVGVVFAEAHVFSGENTLE